MAVDDILARLETTEDEVQRSRIARELLALDDVPADALKHAAERVHPVVAMDFWWRLHGIDLAAAADSLARLRLAPPRLTLALIQELQRYQFAAGQVRELISASHRLGFDAEVSCSPVSHVPLAGRLAWLLRERLGCDRIVEREAPRELLIRAGGHEHSRPLRDLGSWYDVPAVVGVFNDAFARWASPLRLIGLATLGQHVELVLAPGEAFADVAGWLHLPLQPDLDAPARAGAAFKDTTWRG